MSQRETMPSLGLVVAARILRAAAAGRSRSRTSAVVRRFGARAFPLGRDLGPAQQPRANRRGEAAKAVGENDVAVAEQPDGRRVAGQLELGPQIAGGDEAEPRSGANSLHLQPDRLGQFAPIDGEPDLGGPGGDRLARRPGGEREAGEPAGRVPTGTEDQDRPPPHPPGAAPLAFLRLFS